MAAEHGPVTLTVRQQRRHVVERVRRAVVLRVGRVVTAAVAAQIPGDYLVVVGNVRQVRGEHGGCRREPVREQHGGTAGASDLIADTAAGAFQNGHRGGLSGPRSWPGGAR